jgi:hypothetical protein
MIHVEIVFRIEPQAAPVALKDSIVRGQYGG